MGTRRTSALAVLAMSATVAAGCGGPSRDATGGAAPPAAGDCAGPAGPPTTLAAADRRTPEVAVGPRGLQVAVWESRTGGAVEAATREPGGQWSAATELGGPNATGPVVAADADGAVVAWEGYDDGARVVVAARGGHDRWEVPVVLSRAGRRATEPAVATAQDVRVVAWTEADPPAVVVAESPPGEAAWRAATIGTGAGAVSRVEVAATSSGLVAVWLRDRPGGRVVEAAVREGPRRWSEPVALTPPDAYASDAVLAGGEVGVVAWRVDVGADAMEVRARVLDDGRWTPASTLARDVAPPLGVSRSDAQTVAPVVAATPVDAVSGAIAAVVWPQRRRTADGPVDEVAAAVWDATLGWSPGRTVSRPPGEEAGVPAVAADDSGRIVVAWESLIGDRQTARVATLSPSRSGARAPECCADLVPAGQEASAPALATTSDSTVAVWVGTSRGSIEAADLPVAATCA